MIVAKRWTYVWVKELEIHVKAIALGNSPPVLSLGKLVEENKFRYRWDPGRTPYLSAHGNKYKCYPTHNVPFITAGTQAEPDAECGDAPGSASDIPPQAAPKEKPKKKKDKVPKSDSESSGPPDLEEDSGPPPLVDSSSESDAGGNSRRPPKVEPPPPPPNPYNHVPLGELFVLVFIILSPLSESESSVIVPSVCSSFDFSIIIIVGDGPRS